VHELWTQRDLVAAWCRLVVGGLARIRRHLVIEPVTLTITIGLGDPAETGAAYGFVWAALSPAMGEVPFRRLAVTGDWLDATFASSGRLGVSVRTIWSIWGLGWLVARAPWRQTWRVLRGLRRKPKRPARTRADKRAA
jgi:hypothetical protein